MMPLIGRTLSKGAPPTILVSIGMFVFFMFCFWGYKIMTPNTSKDSFFWMLILRGIGMGLLFIPITGISLSTLKGRQIGDGAAFTGMMRQLGGSFGIATITTFMASRSAMHRANLVSKLDIHDPDVMQRVHGLQQSFIAKGQSSEKALGEAYKILDFTVNKQSQVLAYMDVFIYTGILFLICIPFIMMVKRNKQKHVGMEAAH